MKNKVVSHVTYFQEGSHASHVTPILNGHLQLNYDNDKPEDIDERERAK